jgi:pimeloyl-ACP methyl ester carboxylesterase
LEAGAVTGASGTAVELHRWGTGRGGTVLCIHETAASSEAWRPLAAALGERARTIAYDRRGWGRSGAPEPYGRTTVQEQAEDGARVLAELEAPPAVLCGSGLGAVAALDLMLRRPDLAHAAVLIEPPLLAFVDEATEVLSGDGQALREAVEHHLPMRLLVATAGALEAADAGARHEAVAVDAHEGMRGLRTAEFALEADERLLDQVLALTRAHRDVLLFGAQKKDVAHGHEHDAVALGDRKVFARGSRGAREAFSRRRAGAGGLLESRGKPRRAHRLEEIVERVELEGLDGMLVVRGDEDHGRRVLEIREMAREFEPVHARHADVEEQHLRAARRQPLEGFDAVACLTHYRARQFGGDILQELAQPLARGRLVVGDEDADHARR